MRSWNVLLLNFSFIYGSSLSYRLALVLQLPNHMAQVYTSISCFWDQSVDRKDLTKKFELNRAWKEMQLQLITSKNFGIVFLICCFLIKLYWTIHPRNVNSNFKNLKLKGIPKYRQVWNWHADYFTLCFWLVLDCLEICMFLTCPGLFGDLSLKYQLRQLKLKGEFKKN